MLKNKNLSIGFKVIICIIGIISLILNVGIFTSNPNFKILLMFTSLSNILCIVYFIVDIIYLSKNYSKKKTTLCPTIKGIVTMSITVTFLVAQFVLKMNLSFKTLWDASFLGLHYLVPIMTIFDWILFDKKGQIKVYSPLLWCFAPCLYFISAIISAKYGNGFGIDSKYPYPFMDIDKLGINKVYLTILIMATCFIIMGYLYYFIDRKLAKRLKK